MNDKLLPCPHCGGEAYCAQMWHDISEDFYYQAGCTKCMIGILTRKCKTKQAAITVWNRRYTAVPLPDRFRPRCICCGGDVPKDRHICDACKLEGARCVQQGQESGERL